MKKIVTFRPSGRNNKLIAQLEKLAAKENRTLNNYIETILVAHVNERKSA